MKTLGIAAFIAAAGIGAALGMFWRDPRLPAPANGEKADKIVVEKQRRRLYLLRNGQVLREYKIALGFNPNGPKRQEGDGKTPEGNYFISGRNPQSSFHLSLRISYPSPEDRRRAEAAGIKPGGDIMIHGQSNRFNLGRLHTLNDWTAGCIAVTNHEIEEIWKLVDNKTPIEIRP